MELLKLYKQVPILLPLYPLYDLPFVPLSDSLLEEILLRLEACFAGQLDFY